MNSNRFGGTPLSNKKHALCFVNESKTADFYSKTWNDMSVEEKAKLAKQLNLNVPESLLRTSFDDLYDDKAFEIAWNIVNAKLDESQVSNLDLSAKLFANTHNIDEGVISWVVGALVARKLWQKLTKSFKNKILKAAGVPEGKLNTYNGLSIDKLPIMYKDAVNQVLRKHGVKVDESADDMSIAEFAQATQDAQNDVKQELLHNAEPVIQEVESIDVASIPQEEDSLPVELIRVIREKVGSNAYFAKNASGYSMQQQIQNIAGMQFEETLRLGDMKVIASLYWQLSYEQRVKLLQLFDAEEVVMESYDDNLAAIIDAAKHMQLDQMTLMALTIQYGYDIASSINSKDAGSIAKAYAKLSKSQRQMLHDSLNIKFVMESDNLNADGSKSVIQKKPNGKWGILGKDRKTFWDADYDSEDGAKQALAAYHAGSVDEAANVMQEFDKWFNKADSKSYQEQFAKGDIWFRPKKFDALYHIKKEDWPFVKDMWTIYSKDTYSSPMKSKDGMPYQNDKMTTVEQVLSFVLHAFADRFGFAIDEALSEDGKTSFSAAGVAYPTSSIKAILCWLCYDMCQSTYQDFTQASVLFVNFKTPFDFKQLNVASVVALDGTPKLDDMLLPTIVSTPFASGFVAQLIDSTGSATLVFALDGEWCIVKNPDVISDFFAKAHEFATIYKASANLPNMLPLLKRQPSNEVGIANLYQICKRTDSANNSSTSLVHVKQQIELQASPSIAKQAITSPSTKEFLSSIKTLQVVPDTQLLLVNVNNKELVYLNVQKRWYKLSNAQEVDKLFANIEDVDLPKESVESLSQSDINNILGMWQIANPLAKIASVRTKAAKLEVIDADKDKLVVLDIKPNIDVPAMLQHVDSSVVLSFMYEDKLYQMTVYNEADIKNNFAYADVLCQSFQI